MDDALNAQYNQADYKAPKLLWLQKGMRWYDRYFWDFDNKVISCAQSVNILNIKGKNICAQMTAWLLRILSLIIYICLDPNLLVIILLVMQTYFALDEICFHLNYMLL